jgi:GNAT superfamily N-acetyltransferase
MVIVPYRGEMEGLRPLLESWHAESENPFGLELREDALIEHFEGFRAAGGAILVLLDDHHRIHGLMGVCVHPSPLSGELCLEEHMWYVMPDHRSMEVTRRFLNAAEDWGKQRGARFFILTASVLANTDARRVSVMYHRMKFLPFEATYIRSM